MSKNPTKGIPDEKTIRETLKNAGIRGFRKMAGYKPKVLDEDKIEGLSILPYWNTYDDDRAKIIIETDMCWHCAGFIQDFFYDYYGGWALNPYYFTETSQANYHCSACGAEVDEIPF